MDNSQRGSTDDWTGNVRLPSTAFLLAFEAAVRLGSFERASEELSISASAVGKRVMALEDQLGVRLLSRESRGVVPTVAGQEYVEQVRQALALLGRVSLHQRAGRTLRRLTVCSPPTFARLILLPALADFEQQHPDIELEVFLSVPYVGIRPPGAYVEILAGPVESGGADVLLDERVWVVCNPAMARKWALNSPADLHSAPLIRCPLEPWERWFAEAGLDWGEPSVGLRLVDLGLTLDAAARGLGVALGRRSLARPLLESGDLMIPFDISVVPQTHYTVVCRNSKAAFGAAEEFRNWLRRICREQTA